MREQVQLDDAVHREAAREEIARLRDTGALGRSSKLRDLFDYLVERSERGAPPREIEIAQDVFGRAGQVGDDGSGRVYIHRLRKRLDEIYRERPDVTTRIALPLGEYRLVAEVGYDEAAAADDAETAPVRRRGMALHPRWQLVLAALAGAAVALLVAALILSRDTPREAAAARVRASDVWAPLFANGRSVVIAAGDHYLFGEAVTDGAAARLVRDPRIHSREELDAALLRRPEAASRYADVGAGYVPRTVPRAELFLAPILFAAPEVRTLPASQVPAAALLSQNIVYLGLVSGLGPLRAPVASGARFEPGRDRDEIRDRATGRVYASAAPAGDAGAPRRQYGLLSLFAGKEGNRFVVAAGTSDMGLVGLVEALADPARLEELTRAAGETGTCEALYQIDSQGPGVLAIKLLAVHRRPPAAVWAP